MNTNESGQIQDQIIVILVAPKDKANIKLEAQKKGITMRTLAKGS